MENATAVLSKMSSGRAVHSSETSSGFAAVRVDGLGPVVLETLHPNPP